MTDCDKFFFLGRRTLDRVGDRITCDCFVIDLFARTDLTFLAFKFFIRLELFNVLRNLPPFLRTLLGDLVLVINYFFASEREF